MALTRITSTVLGSNAVTTDKMANGSLTARLYGVASIPASALDATASATSLVANINTVSANVSGVEIRRINNIAGAVSTITTADLTADRALISTGGKVAVSAVSSTVLAFLGGTTGTIQTQFDSLSSNGASIVANVTAVEARRVANIAGAISTVVTSDLTASRALVSDGSGKIATLASVTSTELGYVDATSSIQTQLNAGVTNTNSVKANVDAAEANIAGIIAGTKNFTGQVTMGDDLVIQGNLVVNGDTTTSNTINAVIQDRFLMLANSVTGTPSADVGIFMNRGTSGNAAIYYDESTKSFTLSETRDPDSNVVISPTGAANLITGQITATSVKYNGADLNTAITDNRSGAVSTVYKDDLTASRAIVSDGSGKIAVSDVTSTELGYLDGVSSSVQTQLTAGVTETTALEARRVANIAGAVSTITTGNLTASRALVSDASGKVAALASVTSTELGYLDATSSIQTQLDSKGGTTDFQSNDFITYTQLNANINVVSGNVALGLKQLINVSPSADGEGAGNNNFFVATPAGGNPTAIDNVTVTINGVTQAKTNDYLYDKNTGKVTFKDASIPSGLTVQIVTLNPPT